MVLRVAMDSGQFLPVSPDALAPEEILEPPLKVIDRVDLYDGHVVKPDRFRA